MPEELRLDVARALEVALAEDRVVAERALGLAAGGREGVVELRRRADDPHPAAAAAGGRLDDEREADLLGCPCGSVGTPASRAIRFAASLSPPSRSASGRRADPGDPGRDDRLGERGVLGEEAVARVDRVGAGLERGAHVLRPGRDTSAISTRPVGRPGVERAAVVRRDDRDRLDPEPRAGAEDAERDLSAVRDEERADRHGQTLCGACVLPRRDERDGDERAGDADVLQAREPLAEDERREQAPS